MAFIQEWSKRLSMNGSLNHWFTRIHSFIRKLNTAVLLGDSQQICCGFIGNIFIGKIEQKTTILCLKYNTILTSYLLNCCIKSTCALVMFGTNSTRVILLSLLVWHRLSYKCETKRYERYETYRGIPPPPISWILGDNSIYKVVALHHICQLCEM